MCVLSLSPQLHNLTTTPPLLFTNLNSSPSSSLTSLVWKGTGRDHCVSLTEPPQGPQWPSPGSHVLPHWRGGCRGWTSVRQKVATRWSVGQGRPWWYGGRREELGRLGWTLGIQCEAPLQIGRMLQWLTRQPKGDTHTHSTEVDSSTCQTSLSAV